MTISKDALELYAEIKEKIAKLPRRKFNTNEIDFAKRYLGSEKQYLGIKISDLLIVAKDFLKEHKKIGINELTKIIQSLVLADSFEEHIVGGKIFTIIRPEVRQKIPFSEIEKWLSESRGWVEVDVICQSSYTGKEVQENFASWQKAINKFSKSKIISLRRASLVLQTKPNRELHDENMRHLAFKTIERLKHEKDVLITKAVSWLLRSLVFQNKEEVKKYLKTNETSLPRIAYRETIKKIEMGKK